MINSIEDAYPNKVQFKEYSVECECNNLFNVLTEDFHTRIKISINKSDFIANEIKSLEELRDNVNQSGISHSGFYDRHIKLFPYFKSGWERLVSGVGFIATNNEYKFHTDPLLIESKYLESNQSEEYFKKLSAVAIDSIIDGMAHAKYYYWLKEGKFEENKNEIIEVCISPKEENHKPCIKFREDSIILIYGILECYFSEKDQVELKKILNSGEICSYKLLFEDKGNRLTDFFKKLIEHDYIPGCEKNKLEEWIIANFNYISKGKEKEYISDTVHKIVSRNDTPCKQPIIEIMNGKIEKTVKAKNKNLNK